MVISLLSGRKICKFHFLLFMATIENVHCHLNKRHCIYIKLISVFMCILSENGFLKKNDDIGRYRFVSNKIIHNFFVKAKPSKVSK